MLNHFKFSPVSEDNISLSSEEALDIFNELNQEYDEERIFTLDGKEITNEFTE